MAADTGRTTRAALVALLATFAIVTGAGLALGFEPGTAIAGGVGLGVLAALLIWGVARRADSFHSVDEIRPVEPGFPGHPNMPTPPTSRTWSRTKATADRLARRHHQQAKPPRPSDLTDPGGPRA